MTDDDRTIVSLRDVHKSFVTGDVVTEVAAGALDDHSHNPSWREGLSS